MAILRFSDQWFMVFLLLGLLLVVTISGGFVSIWFSNSMHDMFEQVLETTMVGYHYAEELEASLIKQKGFVTYFSIDGDLNWLQRLDQHNREFQKYLTKSLASACCPEAEAILKKIEVQYRLYLDDRKNVIDLYKNNQKTDARYLHPEVREHFFTLLDLCDQYKEFHRNIVDQARLSSIQKSTSMNIIETLMIFAVLLIGTIMAFFLFSRILGPIRKMVIAADAYQASSGKQGVMGLLSDRVFGLIKDVGTTRTELERSKEMLWYSEKMALVGKLASEVAHTIRNPLTSIKMRLYSLQKNLDLTTTQQEDLAVVSDELKRLDNVVRNFLEFSRPPRLVKKKINVSQILDMSLQLLLNRLQQYTIKTDRVYHTLIPDIEADPELLKEAIINLIVNASEVMKDGGILTITEEEGIAEEIGRVIIIRISDTGPGIQDEIIENIFEPFFSTKEDGSGLGLSIARKIIEEHDGRLDVQSTQGQGSTFIIILPIKENNHEGNSDR